MPRSQLSVSFLPQRRAVAFKMSIKVTEAAWRLLLLSTATKVSKLSLRYSPKKKSTLKFLPVSETRQLIISLTRDTIVAKCVFGVPVFMSGGVAGVAQWVEHRTPGTKTRGSYPVGSTRKKNCEFFRVKHNYCADSLLPYLTLPVCIYTYAR